MIYISAQPDAKYFLWQLEVQLENFRRAGIPPAQIHVLIGFHPDTGLNKAFNELITSGRARFFPYPDERPAGNYKSSIRPHLLKKHFREHSYLSRETIFYHDSDIIFRERINEGLLEAGDSCFLSATPYISTKIIKAHAGEDTLHELLALVGVSSAVAEENEPHTGGAQYVLKNISWSFWEKVETDCEKIFNYMTAYNERHGKGLQAWCADMWAILWNSWREGFSVKIHPELDFCWPADDISCWYNTKILHNTGVLLHESETLFCKGLYLTDPPYFNNFSSLYKDKCSVKFAEAVEHFTLQIKRTDLRDVTFIFPVRVNSNDTLQNLDLATRYISKYFSTNILILEIDDIPRINTTTLLSDIKYLFLPDEQREFNAARFLNSYTGEIATKVIAICEADAIVPYEQIMEATGTIRNGEAAFVYPFNKEAITVNQRGIDNLRTTLDYNTIAEVTNKLSGTEISFGGWCFINREVYILAGMENEKIRPWGYYNNIERAKRLNILGYEESRVNGNFLQLPRYQHAVSEQSASNHLINNLREYLGICKLRNRELTDHISTWERAAFSSRFNKDQTLS